ncbi:MAG: hypothetical protein ACYCPW_05250 [Nitrososphaerales archaeon]
MQGSLVHINNCVTASKARVDADKDTSVEQMKKLIAQVDPILRKSKIYKAKADLNGITVELVTNVFHQFDFWQENWNPATSDAQSKATLYSVNGVKGLAPKAFYCAALNASLFVNTEYYGQCKSWALGMAAAIFAKEFNTHSIHGALASLNGKGVVIIAPTGTGKTTQAFKLFQLPKGKIVGDDWVYIAHSKEGKRTSKLVAVQPEKSLYMRTETEKDQLWLRTIFDKCKLENVLTDQHQCDSLVGNDSCKQNGGKCILSGTWTDHCYYGFANARALVPREALLGPEKVADEARVKLLVLLRRDNESPAEVKLNSDQAIDVLKKGEYQIRPGAGPKEQWGKMGYESWYNPYLLEKDDEGQEKYFRSMIEDWKIPCILLNTGVETVEQTHSRITSALKRVS